MSVKVEKLNPVVKVVYYDTITLGGTGDEKTAVRFTVKGQEIVDVNNHPKSLVDLTRTDAPAAAPLLDAVTGAAVK